MAGGPLVKMLGAGIGLASEAIHHSRAKKTAAKERANSSCASSPASHPASGTVSPRDSASGSRSVIHESFEAPAGNYVYSPPGTAGPSSAPAYAPAHDAEHNPAYNPAYSPAYTPTYEAVAGPSTSPSPSTSYPSAEEEKRRVGETERLAFADDAFGMYDEEAIWELDDMAEYVDPPAYSEVDNRAEDRATSINRVAEAASALQSADSHRYGTVDAVGSPEAGSEAAEAPAETSAEDKVKKEIRMVRELVCLAGPVPTPCQRLPCPVIIPQRRPRNKSRGFVRAYAPVLGECAGIDQDVFLRFLKDWHQASKASAWIDVVYVAAGIVGFVPEVGAQVVSIVVQVVAGTARELQSRRRNNSFLDRANQDLFMPRGLFAMVMAFKDEVPGSSGGGGLVGGLKSVFGKNVVSAQRLDLNQNTVKYSQMTAMTNSTAADASSRPKFRISSLRATSGATHTELELPQAADLVYPDLDKAAEHDLGIVDRDGAGGSSAEQAKARTKWNSSGKFVQDYLDRRAQAAYESEHRGSSVAVPAEARKPFMSRYADPNHAANSGSLLALLTGGAVVLPPKMSAKERIMGFASPRGENADRSSPFGRDLYGREPPAPGMKQGFFGREKPIGLIGAGIGLITSGATMAFEKSKQKMTGQAGQSRYEPNPPAPYGESSQPAPYGGAPSSANRTTSATRGSGRKKIMQHDVFYLMVVNLPTDEEIAAAMAQLEQLTKK
ncbi:fad binding domain protein [Ophiostoma piceae UAMH 11346]|uniref:Fad binding domain protein n=1 Tax=Ophiostoma piceae (strain UAMH 11346) TaxID=1262450 RepID=S3CDF1_OPHP1|nr:fad binding domain protein [Ophiostoma piceae UAMH 11346]